MSTLLHTFPRLSIIMLLFIFSLALSPLTTNASPLKENQMVPNIYFKDIDNKEHHLNDYRGKWLFLNFWAGYCDICRKEIPTLIRFQQKYKDKVTLLGISFGGETNQEVRAAMARYKFNYTIVPGQANITKIFKDVIATPTTIIISPQGRMITKAVGRQSWEELIGFINADIEEPVRIWDM